MKLKPSNVFRLKKVQKKVENQTRLKWKLCLFAGFHRNPSPTLFVTLTTKLPYPIGFDSYSIAAEEKARELEIQARYKSDLSWNILSLDLCCLWRQLPNRVHLIYQVKFFKNLLLAGKFKNRQSRRQKIKGYIIFFFLLNGTSARRQFKVYKKLVQCRPSASLRCLQVVIPIALRHPIL